MVRIGQNRSEMLGDGQKGRGFVLTQSESVLSDWDREMRQLRGRNGLLCPSLSSFEERESGVCRSCVFVVVRSRDFWRFGVRGWTPQRERPYRESLPMMSKSGS